MFLFGGAHGQGQSPEAVGVAGFAAVGGEADVAAARRLFFYGAKVGADFGGAWDFYGAVFEGHAHWVR